MRYDDTSGSFNSAAAGMPDARDDTDNMAAGSRSPATGNAISGEGTATGAAGADIIGNAPGQIVALQGANGSDTADSGGSLQAAGRYGTLTMNQDGGYSYRPNGPAPENARDVFSYTLADQSGGRDTALLAIDIGHTPSVAANAQQLVPGPDGVVTLPPGVELSDVHVVGRNLVIDMPDGSQMVIIDGAVFVPQLVLNGVEVPSSNLAALLIDSEPKPAAGTPQSGGGNFAVDVGPLDPGVPLGDLLPPTDLSFTPPEFQEPNQIPDDEPELIIIPDGQPGAVNAVDSVDESGLPERTEEPEGTLEPQNIETTTGVISIDAEDGIDSVTINGVEIDSVGDSVETARGILTITSIDLDSGEIGYSYTVTDNTTDGVDDFDDFTVVVTDDDGDTATGTLHIDIADDEPIARNDTDSVTLEDPTAVGNVMTAVGTNNSPAGIDTVGADDATLTAVAGSGGADSSFDINGNLVVNGTFGTLTIDAEGNYTYEVTGEFPETASTDVFTYTLTDGDGDTATATLTITIPGDPNDIPEIVRVDNTLVDEDGLDGANLDANRPGETDSTEEETDTGSILVDYKGDVPANLLTAITLVDNPALDNELLTTDGQRVIFSLEGGKLVGRAENTDELVITIEITGVVAGAGGQATYSYLVTLHQPVEHAQPGVEDTITLDNVGFQITDSNGDTASGTFDVAIVDDLPIALDPPPENPQTPGPDPLLGGAVDEDDLDPDGNSDVADGDDLADPSSTTVGGPAGSLGALFNAGADSPMQNFGLNSSAAALETLTDQGLTSNGHDVLYDVEGGVLTGYADLNDDGEINDGDGSEVFTLTVNPNGSWSFTLLDQLDHPIAGTEDNLYIDFSGVITAEDADGDPVTAAEGAFIIDVDDDVPQSWTAEGCPDDANVTNQPGTQVLDIPLNLPNVGADQPATLSFGVSTDPTDPTPVMDNGDPPQQIESNGQPLFYFINESNPLILEARTSVDADPVFTITLDPDADPPSYDFNLIGNISSEVSVSIDNLDSIGGGNVDAKAIDVPGTPFDLILSTQSPETINTSEDFIGVGGGQSLDDGDVVRVDFVQNAFTTGSGGGAELNYGEYYTVTSYRQDVAGLNSSQFANFTVTAINVVESGNPADPADGDDVFFGDANDTIVTDATLTIYDSLGNPVDIEAYNLANGAAPDLVVSENPDGSWTITGMPQDFDFQISSASGFEAVEILAIEGSDSFKLGVIDLTRSEQVEVDFTVPVILTDADGDPVECDIDVFLTPGVSVQSETARVDDDGLDGANPAGLADIDANEGDDNAGEPGDTEAVFVGQLTAGGGSGTITFSLVAPAGTVMVGQEEVEITGTGTLLTGTISSGDRIGEDLFTISLDPNTGVYTVTLLLNVLHEDTGLNDENGSSLSLGIGYEATDGDTTSEGAINIIFNDDVPTAVDDTDSVVEGGTTDGDVIANDTPGADGLPANAVVGVAKGDTEMNLSGGVGVGGTGIAGDWGTLVLNADGTYTYTATEGLDPPPGTTDKFTYTIVDNDGDLSNAELIISVVDDLEPTLTIPGTTAPSTNVSEVGLPPHDGLPAGTGEVADGDPNNASNQSEVTSGTITYTDGDTPATVTIDGFVGGPVAITGPYPQTIFGEYGTLTITGHNTTTNVISYTYTLTDSVDHENDLTPTDTFAVTVTDVDGDDESGNLVITIANDAPIANFDTDSAVEGGSTGGNVILGTGTTNSPDGIDVPGADGLATPAVVGVVAGDTDVNLTTGAGVGGNVVGTYGTLVLGANGAYTYTVTQPVPDGGATDTFTYTIIDNDGDASNAELIISIANDPEPVIGTIDDLSVDEDGLVGANPDDGAPGEVAHGDNDTASDTFTVNFGSDVPGDTEAELLAAIAFINVGDLNLQLEQDGEPVEFALNGNNQIVGSVNGTSVITITITSATAGLAGAVTYGYEVELLGPVDHTNGDDTEGGITLTGIEVQVTDSSGDQDEATFDVDIYDDVPEMGEIQDGTASNDPTDPASTGTLNYTPSADGTCVITIAPTLTNVKSEGQQVVGQMTDDNTYTAYIDDDGEAGITDGDTVVFTIDVNTDGTYTFDLQNPLDGLITTVPIGDSSSFGAGPAQLQILLEEAGGQELAVVAGFADDGTFNLEGWLAGDPATGLEYRDVNGSTVGWGVDENTFSTGEALFFDLSTAEDLDGAGPYVAPAVDLPPASSATFDFFGYKDGETVHVLVRYDDGTFDTYLLDPTGNHTLVTYDAPDGLIIESVEIFAEDAGAGKVSLVSVGAPSEDVDVNIPVTITIEDCDGDTVSDSFVINVADDNLPSTAEAAALSFSAQVESISLLSDDSSTSNKAHGRTFDAANNNSVLLGAIAAAGLASTSAAARNGGSDRGETDSQLTSLTVEGASKLASNEDSEANHALTGETEEAVDAKADGATGGRSNPNDVGGHSLTKGDLNETQSPTELLAGTDAPQSEAPAQSALTSGGVAMPSAEMLIAAKGDGAEGEAKSTALVEQAVADALAGGSDGPSIEAVIDAVSNEGPGGDKAGSDALASLGQAGVSHWDTAGLAHFPGGQAQFTMESIQLHHDAVQPAA